MTRQQPTLYELCSVHKTTSQVVFNMFLEVFYMLYVVCKVVFVVCVFTCFWLFSDSLSSLGIASNTLQIAPLKFPENDLNRLLNY